MNLVRRYKGIKNSQKKNSEIHWQHYPFQWKKKNRNGIIEILKYMFSVRCLFKRSIFSKYHKNNRSMGIILHNKTHNTITHNHMYEQSIIFWQIISVPLHKQSTFVFPYCHDKQSISTFNYWECYISHKNTFIYNIFFNQQTFIIYIL